MSDCVLWVSTRMDSVRRTHPFVTHHSNFNIWSHFWKLIWHSSARVDSALLLSSGLHRYVLRAWFAILYENFTDHTPATNLAISLGVAHVCENLFNTVIKFQSKAVFVKMECNSDRVNMHEWNKKKLKKKKRKEKKEKGKKKEGNMHEWRDRWSYVAKAAEDEWTHSNLPPELCTWNSY